MRIVNPLLGSQVLPYTGKPRTPAEQAEKLPNGRMIFRVTKTAAQHVADDGPPALDMGNYKSGDPVLAMVDGEYRRTPNAQGGNIITGTHDEGPLFRTVYAHLSEYNIPAIVATLKAGAVIGFVGDTGSMAQGAHLHLETYEIGGKAVDPSKYLNLTELPSFADVPPSHPFYEEIEWARENRILYGIGDMFYPDRVLTRGQAAVLAFRLARLEGE